MKFEGVLLVDAENVGCFHYAFNLVTQMTGINRFVVRRAFGRWRDLPDRLKQEAFDLSIDLIEAAFGPHGAEVTLARHALDLTEYLRELKTYLIISGDGSLVPLVQRLHQLGKKVVVCGREGCTSRALRAACDFFVPIPASTKPERAEAPIAVSAPVQNGNTHALHFLQTNADYLRKMRNGGLPISQLADALRQLKDPLSGERRWLVRLLAATCDEAPVCLAKSAHGDHRLFVKGCVPEDFMVVCCPSQPAVAAGILTKKGRPMRSALKEGA